MEFRTKRKYQFLDTLKVGDVVAWENVADRHSIRATATAYYSYGVSVKRMLGDKGKEVLRVERTK